MSAQRLEQGPFFVFGQSHTPDTLQQKIFESKLNVRAAILRRLDDNPSTGIDLGQAYKAIVYDAVDSYAVHNLSERNPEILVGAFGSTRRGELCLYSDTDLILLFPQHIQREDVSGIAGHLNDFLTAANLKPDVKQFSPQDPFLTILDKDFVFREIVKTSEQIRRTDVLWNEIVEPVNRFDQRQKALYSIFECQKPRVGPDRQTNVFNMKWGQGGFADFAVIRAMAAAWGVEGGTTAELLKGLHVKGLVSTEEYSVVSTALSDLLVIRDGVHFFAKDTAERLGPKSIRFLSQHYPVFGNFEQLQSKIAEMRLSVHSTFVRLRDVFLQQSGIDPWLYNNFSKLPTDEQLDYVGSLSGNNRWIPVWCTRSSDVVNLCVDLNPDWMTLIAATTSSDVKPITLQKVELLTRDDPSLDFVRVLIAANNHTSPHTLVNLYRNSSNKKARSIAQHRLTHMQYSGTDLTSNTVSDASIIAFYPAEMQDQLLSQPVAELNMITPGKVYLNYAGRVAVGKNFDAYIRTLVLCEQRDLDFEAHIFGAIEPTIARELHVLWNNPEYASIAKRIKYHGRYTIDAMNLKVDEMRDVGSPLFLFSKGLTSKELLMMGQPILTTCQGNMDIVDNDMSNFDEARLLDGDYLLAIVDEIISRTNNKEALMESGDRAKVNIEAQYGLTAWGRNLEELFLKVSDGNRRLSIIGTSGLYVHHGPSTWSRNLLSYFSHIGSISGRYDFPEETEIFLPQTLEVGNEFDLISERAVVEQLQRFIEVIDTVSLDKALSKDQIDLGVDAMLKLAEISNCPNILCSKRILNAISLVLNPLQDSSDSSRHYSLLVCDEVNQYNLAINPHLKLARLIQLIQRGLAATDLNLSCGVIPGFLAICAKKKKGTPFVHVDHVLATENLLLRGITDSEFYSPEEKRWFNNLHYFMRSAINAELAAYIALWPVNEKIARDQFGIPQEKIAYIPNGVSVKS